MKLPQKLLDHVGGFDLKINRTPHNDINCQGFLTFEVGLVLFKFVEKDGVIVTKVPDKEVRATTTFKSVIKVLPNNQWVIEITDDEYEQAQDKAVKRVLEMMDLLEG